MDVFRAIADPIRRELLLRLAEAPARVVDVAASHPVSRPAISKHPADPERRRPRPRRRPGRQRHYSLDTPPLAEVGELLGALTTRQPPISDRHLDALATEVRRAARDRRHSSRRPDPTLEELHGGHRMNPTGTLEDDGRTLVLTRCFATRIGNVWASVTDPERLSRWFGTWSGDRVGDGDLERRGRAGTCP